jgi:two-component sensor histidine kinase
MNQSLSGRARPGVDARLRALHEITLDLSRAPDASSLCKRAVEMGVAGLGFDRLGIWLFDPGDPEWMVGTWGTDENGRLKDESDDRYPRAMIAHREALYSGLVPYARERGGKTFVPLWDGTEMIGEMAGDKLITRRPMEEDDCEILVLLARSVGHLRALKRSEAALAEALEVKAVLLSELRHRTKNSFALIASLISLETGRAKDPRLYETLRKLSDRVLVLTSLYGRIGPSASLERVELGGYLGRLAADLAEGYGAERRGITLRCALESLEIDMARAVPLGLIANELVTDALKHAFPAGRRGCVVLGLRSEGDSSAVLSVADDGVGLPEGFVVGESAGLGITLVVTLCDQIGGELSVGPGPGADFAIRFPL